MILEIIIAVMPLGVGLGFFFAFIKVYDYLRARRERIDVDSFNSGLKKWD